MILRMFKKLKYWIITILFGGSLIYLGAPVSDTTILSQPLTEVQKIDKIKVRDYGISYFENNTTHEIVTREITREEYDALGLKDAPQPQLAGHTFKQAVFTADFNEVQHILKDYEYYKDGIDVASTTLVRIKVPDHLENTIFENDVIGGKLSTEGLQKLK